MEWYEWLLIAVGVNWGLPLLTWVYPLVMWLVFRDFKFVGFYGPFAKFRLLGDERVYWNDPDDGACSGEYVIAGKGPDGGYFLKNEAGSEVEAPASELDFMEPWHVKWWKDWGGVGLYWFMCFRDRPSKWDDEWVGRTVVHEGTHNIQTAVFGLMKFVLDLVFMLFIFVFLKDKHPYLDNPFERQARRRAGQQVDVPKEDWPQGKNDRWPWW